MISEKELNELVEIEMDEFSHDDDPSDYESKLDFYLSNAEKESYLDYLEGRGFSNVSDIQDAVISRIKEIYSARSNAAKALGKIGGSKTSDVKAKSSAKNGKKGGRPPKKNNNDSIK